MKHIIRTGILLLAGIGIGLCSTAKPRKAPANVTDVTRSITDTAIIFPESFETGTQKMLEGWYMTNYTSTDDRYRTVPDAEVTDEVIITRLQNIPAVVPLPFNSIVRRYIDQYTKYGRATVAAILGLNNYYLPIFEQALEEENLPLELKYLPMIESGLDPNAVSKHGAAGLWQFTLAAAKGFGMEVNSLVDERRDPYLASQKAAAFLRALYENYGDWGLVIAAYNCGPGTVNKAIRRAGGDPSQHNFWTIYNYLPAETRGYVPKFIAANYVMNYYKDHNISPVLPTKPLITDTVAVNTRVHFDQISKVLNIPMEELRILNPQFRRDIIPGTPQSTYYLILPSQQIHAYILSEDAILNYEASKYAVATTAEPAGSGDTPAPAPGPVVAEETPQPSVTPQQEAEVEEVVQSGRKAAPGCKFITHKVGPEESLGTIAKRYGVAPQQIKEWNSLRRNQLRVGQKLLVQVPDGKAPKTQQSQQPVAQKTQQPAPATKTAPAQKPAAPVQTAQTKTGKKNNGKKTDPAPTSKGKKDSKKKRKKESAKPTTYTVKDGDSYERIARRHGVSVEELKKTNKAKGDMIHPGDKVTIPARKGAKATKGNKSGKPTRKKGKKR